MVDREWIERDNRRAGRRLKEAKLASTRSLEDVWCEPGAGLDKAVVRSWRPASGCERSKT